MNQPKILFIFLFLITLVFSNSAISSPSFVTFQSRIVKPDGYPLEASSVNFRITVTDTIGTCVIFQEDFSNRNMSGSKGLINLTMGNGTKVFPAGPMTLNEVFNNYNSPTFNCQSGGSVNASTTDKRKFILQFNDGSGWQTVPTMDINSNPFALQAMSSQKLGDYPAQDYLRPATLPSCGGSQALHFNGASFTCVAIGAGITNGGDTGVLTIGTNDGSALNFETNNTARMTIDATGNVGIGTAVLPSATLHTVTTGAKTSSTKSNIIENTSTSGTNTINKTGLEIQSTGVWNGTGSVNTGLTVNVSGGTTNYAATFQGGNVGIGTTTPAATLDVVGDVKVGNSSAVCNATTQGSIRYNTGTAVLEFCNGSSWNLVQAAACTDATPASFTFSDQSNQTTSTQITSNIVQISGFNCTVPVTISGVGTPQFQICSDVACGTVVQGWTSSPSSVVSGQYMQIRQTSDAAGGAPTFATVIVGGTASIWTISTAGGDCVATTPPVGTVCADGTIYAGLSPDTSAKMFTTRCDYGQTWNGSACTGARLAQNWNNGTTNWTTTGFTNFNTGKANSSGISALADAGSVHAAARTCEDLNQDGYTDWYLPALNELNIMYVGKNAIRNFDVSGSSYWSSSEYFNTHAYSQRFSDGYQNASTKSNGLLVRCVRR